jgi:hypothetical protein
MDHGHPGGRGGVIRFHLWTKPKKYKVYKVPRCTRRSSYLPSPAYPDYNAQMSEPFTAIQNLPEAKLQQELRVIRKRAENQAKTRAHNKRVGIVDPRDSGKWPPRSLWRPYSTNPNGVG